MISEPVQLAIIGGITTILTGNLVVSLTNLFKHKSADGKLDTIKTLTDGTITALRGELNTANTRIADLNTMVHLLMETKTEFEKEYIKRRQEELEAKLTEKMQESEDARIALNKARLSPAIKPEDL